MQKTYNIMYGRQTVHNEYKDKDKLLNKVFQNADMIIISYKINLDNNKSGEKRKNIHSFNLIQVCFFQQKRSRKANPDGCSAVLLLFCHVLFWPVTDQKEDTEEGKVGGTRIVNKQNIYAKSVSTGGRSVRPKLSSSTGGSRYLSFVPPTGRVWHKAFI